MKVTLSTIVDFIRHGDLVAGAIDPDTGKEFQRPGATLKIAAWLAKTPWAARQIAKWAGMAGAALATWLGSHGGGDHTESIVTGAVSALLMLSELIISWLCAKAKIDPQKKAPSPFKLAATPSTSLGLSDQRPSFFNRPTVPLCPRDIKRAVAISPQPPDPEDDLDLDLPPQPMQPMMPVKPEPRDLPNPMFPKPVPLGEKGQAIIAECKKQNEAEPAPPVRGTLRGEIDGLVIIDAPEGIKTLVRSDYDFYLKCP